MASKSAISFGLVHIPISLHTATKEHDIHFNQLHKTDHARIRYQKVCGHCGQEISSGDIVKGFAYDKDKYIVLTDDDFETIKTEKDRSMHILHFARLDQISPVYYDKTYHTVPEKGGEKAFELLRAALLDEQKIAIAKTVLGSKETLIALIPEEGGLLAQTMFFEDEIVELPKAYDKKPPSSAELSMAKTLIQSMDQPFEPAAYHDDYQQRLRELISGKIAGKEIVSPQSEPQGTVIDLMEALKASIDQQKSTAKAGAQAKQKTANAKAGTPVKPKIADVKAGTPAKLKTADAKTSTLAKLKSTDTPPELQVRQKTAGTRPAALPQQKTANAKPKTRTRRKATGAS